MRDDVHDDRNHRKEYRSYQSSDRIKGLMSLSPDFPPQNAHEKLFCDLVREILLISPDKKRLNEFANRVFEAQVLSLQQKNKDSKWEELLSITFKKGGESLLFYRCSFPEKILDQEIECLRENVSQLLDEEKSLV